MPPRPKDIPLDEAKAAYEQGATLAELGTKYDCAASTVRSTLLAAGVPMRPRGGQKGKKRGEPAAV